MPTSGTEVRELVTGLIVEDEALVVDLDDGRTVTVPLAWFPRLSHGTAIERANWRLIASGEGVHWPELDEDISISSIVSGRRSGETQESLRNWLESRGAINPVTAADSIHLSSADCQRLTLDLGQFTVALFGGESLQVPGRFMGSGTLVTVAESRYILTAGHVWRELKKCRYFTLTYKTEQENPLVIETSHVRDTTVGPGQPEEWGPDISFVRLVPDQATTIEAGERVFYNLSKRKKAALGAGLDVKAGCWVVMGAPEELVDQQHDHAGKPKIEMTIRGFFSEGIHDIHARSGFDYLDVVVPNDSYRYGGVSGGSLWQVLVNRSANGELSWDHSGLNLAGVAFYDHGPGKAPPRLLRCHGKRSIYVTAPA